MLLAIRLCSELRLWHLPAMCPGISYSASLSHRMCMCIFGFRLEGKIEWDLEMTAQTLLSTTSVTFTISNLRSTLTFVKMVLWLGHFFILRSLFLSLQFLSFFP